MDAPVTSTRADVKEVKADVKEVKADVKDVKAEIKDGTVTEKVAVPTTTAEDNRINAGQRRVNLIWEGTQATIASAVTGAVIFSELQGRSSELLGNAFTLIIAIYFVRMNHTKIGGVGGTDTR